MNIFEHATTNTEQGDIGEARAIYEFTRLGYKVSRTLFDSSKYELIIDKDGVLQRVQVKTTNHRKKKQPNSWQVQLAQTGGNRKINTTRAPQISDYDLCFVLTGDGRIWLLPMSEIAGKRNIGLGATGRGAKFIEYELK